MRFKKTFIRFFICCYFGDSKNIIKSAIDRAYVDMAAHVPIFEKDEIATIETKWECRLNASKHIEKGLEKYNDYNNYVEWHEIIIKKIKKIYDNKLKYGRAQKWLNMTIKYLFVFKNILGINDERLKSIKNFLENTHIGDYYIPIDSYVLRGSGIDSIKNLKWTAMTDKAYKDVNDTLKNHHKDFKWEFKKWEDFSKQYKQNDKDSYGYYYEHHK